MKTSPFLPCNDILGMLAALPTPSAPAQTPSPTPPAHEAKPDFPGPDGNYVLSLSTPADKHNGPEMAVILALFAECAGDAASTGLMLRPGEPVQMIKSGELYFNLRLERYNTSTPR